MPESLLSVASIADPTSRTLATLHREIENLADQTSLMLEAHKESVAEKFSSIAREFDLLERGRTEQKADTKQAVDAALIAQKEAVKEQTLASEKSIAKSEAATAKQIDQLGINFNQAISAANATIADVKERLISVVSNKAGVTEQVATTQATHADARGNINTLVAVAAVVGPMVTIIAMRAFGL